MKRRMIAMPAVLGTTFASLVVTASAFAAEDDGEGVVGETDDKIVTFVSLGVLVFFVALVVLATLLEIRLEKRKEAADAARARQRVGW